MKETPRAIKLREAGIRKYGSVEAWSQAMREHGAKATRSTSGGFAHMRKSDPERLKQLSREAALKRWHEKAENTQSAQEAS